MKKLEAQEQQALFQWAAYAQNQTPELELLFHIPNGGDRHPAVAAKMKAEGVRRGVPDLCLPVPRGPYHGLYVELKRPTPPGGKKVYPKKDQRFWIRRLREQGYQVAVAYGFDEARAWILGYLKGHVI